MQQQRLYVDGIRTASGLSVTDLATTLASKAGDDDTFAWIDLTTDDGDALSTLARTLDIHELAVESALTGGRRPKLVRFDSHLVLTVCQPTASRTGEIRFSWLTAFLAPNLVLTVRQPDFPIDDVAQRVDENADLASNGPAFIVWALLDVITDSGIDTLELLDADVDRLSQRLFERPYHPRQVQERAFLLRRSIARLRHVALPTREAITTLIRRESRYVPQPLQPYFADVYDHTLHSTDWAESLRDQVASILESNIALQGNRMNEIMKKVTSWAAIIAVPTAITGFFGQNFAFLGAGTEWGTWLSIGLIVLSGGALWRVFRRNDWL